MTDRHPHEVTAALATAADADYEVDMGVSFVGLNALVMRRYMYEYGWKHADFAPFAINAHANAVHNPYARLRHKITLEDFEKSAMIATPINLLDASPIGDGAAAVYLVPADTWLPGARILVAASASATDTIAIHDRSEALFLAAAYQSARQAYQQAGVGPQILTCSNCTMPLPSCRRFRWKPAVLPSAARACSLAWTARSLRPDASRFARAAGSRRAGIRSARPGSTRSSRWRSNCAGNAARPRCRKRASAWRRISAARAPPSSPTS